ncbi:MAG: hypothetical protein K0Q93_1148 [Nocardioidaceae bacterium]|jgi:hypothetical protein|nr:hypothetical protein [Nocardioidaceae bacterium]
MHVRRQSSRADRALDQAKDLGAQAQSRAVDAAAVLSEAAQTTLAPAAADGAKRVQEAYHSDVKPALANAAMTAGAAALAAATLAREEADKRTKNVREEAEKRTRKTRKEARQRTKQARKDLVKSTAKARKEATKRGSEAAGRARLAVGIEKPKPKRHWFRNVVVSAGLAAVAAWAVSRSRTQDDDMVIPTTPTRAPSAGTAPADASTAGMAGSDGVDAATGDVTATSEGAEVGGGGPTSPGRKI